MADVVDLLRGAAEDPDRVRATLKGVMRDAVREIESLRARLSQAGAGGVDAVALALEPKCRAFTGGANQLAMNVARELAEVAVAALAASPSAGEPVAWRWRLKGRTDWIVTVNRDDIPEQFGVTGRDKIRHIVEPEVQPLYATPPAPTTLSLEAAEILYERHRDRCRGHHGKRIMPAWKDALPETQALYREDIASLTAPTQEDEYTYASKQATRCAVCQEHKHTPLRRDEMGGYVCLTCLDKRLNERATPSSPVSSPSPAGGVREAAQNALDYLTVLYNAGEIDGQVGGEIMSDLAAALSSPATGEVVDKEAYDNMVAWMSMNAPYRHMMTFRAVLAALNPAPGHGERGL